MQSQVHYPAPVMGQVQYPVQGQPLLNAQGQPVQTVILNPVPVTMGPRVYDNYDSKKSKALGWTQIAAGIFSVLCAIGGIVCNIYADQPYHYNFNFTFYVGYGIWCAVFYIISGTFAVLAARTHGMCYIVTCMVMSIITAVIVWFQIGFSASSIAFDNVRRYGYVSDSASNMARHGSMAFGVFLLVAGLCEFVAAIWSSVLGCRVICCGQSASGSQPQVLYVNTAVPVAAAPQPQPMAYPYNYQTSPMPVAQAQAQWPQQQPVAVDAKAPVPESGSPPPAYSMEPMAAGFTAPPHNTGPTPTKEDRQQLIPDV